MAVYEIADELDGSTKFCATICRAKSAQFMTRGFIPHASDETATVTFIGVEGKAYAVTANHVVEHFRCEAKAEEVEAENYFLPARPGRVLPAPFIRPVPVFPLKAPDIGMMPISPDLPAAIGKKIYHLHDHQMPERIPAVLAAGFPTKAKKDSDSRPDAAVELPGVILLAEDVGSSIHSDQMQFYSEITENFGNRPTYEGDISGMSGGPVFWSEGERHGLLGFVKQCMEEAPSVGGKRSRVSVVCQRANYATFVNWAAYVDREYPRQREQLNERLRQTERPSEWSR